MVLEAKESQVLHWRVFWWVVKGGEGLHKQIDLRSKVTDF